jgi:hypothetical protein
MRSRSFCRSAKEDKFEGVIDVVNQKAIVWGPAIANEGLEL